MSDNHYSDDDMLAKLLGLGPEDAHLDSCEICSLRWNQFRQRHQLRHCAENEASDELLAAQKRAVFARIERNPRKLRLAWMPMPAAALLLALLAFILFKPASQQQSSEALLDDKALQDVFAVASRMEPAGLAPVKSLFEVKK